MNGAPDYTWLIRREEAAGKWRGSDPTLMLSL
jgi:hypothetical protein